ncbi:MAG: type II secretion system F family protein, partial [Candidatus Methylomirabilaceae bacterium]
MPVYGYRGRARGGRLVIGQMEAAAPDVVAEKLRRLRILPTSVKESSKPRDLRIPGFGRRVRDRDLAVFTRQIATMLNAGLPLVQCLEVLASQQPKKRFKMALTEIRDDLEAGSTLAGALKRHPKVFSHLFSAMIEAGEAGGFLDTTLNRLAVYIEKSMTLRRK